MNFRQMEIKKKKKRKTDGLETKNSINHTRAEGQCNKLVSVNIKVSKT